MALKDLVASIKRKEVLMPYLRNFLESENKRHKGRLMRSDEIVIKDAELTIKAFKERKAEYNHGREFQGEFFHPSRLGTCLRALFFEAKDAPKNRGYKDDSIWREFMIFETGTYVGVIFANLCERAGILKQREVPIMNRKHKVVGHADVWVTIEEEDYVVEVKTINAVQFSKLLQPQDSHRRQVMAYMKCLKVKKGLVVYLEKDRHATKEFVVEFDPDYYAEHVKGRIDRHFYSVNHNELPEKEGTTPQLMPCRFCCYTEVCFGTIQLRKFTDSLKSDKLRPHKL